MGGFFTYKVRSQGHGSAIGGEVNRSEQGIKKVVVKGIGVLAARKGPVPGYPSATFWTKTKKKCHRCGSCQGATG